MWCADGVLEVGFEFDECGLTDESFSGGVSDKGGRLAEVGLVGEDLESLSVEGAELEAPGTQVHTDYHCTCLHLLYSDDNKIPRVREKWGN